MKKPTRPTKSSAKSSPRAPSSSQRSATKASPKSSPRKKSAAGKAAPKKTIAAKRPAAKVAGLQKTTLKKPVAAKQPKAKKTAASGSREQQMAETVIRALEDLKARQIVSLDVRSLTDVMDIMVIASGTSNRHVKSLADHAMMEMKKAGYRHSSLEGADAGEWVLVDFGGVVLHVMQPHIREFYDLERLWGTPRSGELPQ